MESFGERLRRTRENLSYSIEQASRDTNISKRYLVALENEDFSVFPGETYLKGFLTNYAEYLGLEGEELVNIYKNMKIQEQPVPLDQLLESKSERSPKLFIIGASLFVAVALIVVLILTQPFGEGVPVTETEEKNDTEQEYVFKDYIKTYDIAKGTKITVTGSDDKERGVLVFHAIDNNVVIASDYEQFELAIGMKKQVDLNNDSTLDVEIRINDIYESGTERHAKIELLKLTATSIASSGPTDQESIDIAKLAEIYGTEAQVLASAAEPTAFTADTLFSGGCMFIYYIDDKPREQKYMYANQTVSLPVAEKVELRFSNAGTVTLKISEKQIQLGGFGQIAARLITWKKDETKNTYHLLSLPVK
ncbi:MAG: helix-turn-helix domain-containing protein [Spirochaetales bacterium]|nr:helix-turn-helix domain-containing protein [Spirochaetales bacterium]